MQQNYPDILVPAELTTILDDQLEVTNPDPCRPAMVLYEGEIDVDVRLPAPATATVVFNNDDIYRLSNSGNAAIGPVHTQVSKVFSVTAIPPGATVTLTQPIQVRGGNGGATYSRAQSAMRAFLFIL